MNTARIKDYYASDEYLKKLRDRAEQVQKCANDAIYRRRQIIDVYSVDFERFCEDFLFLIIPEFNDAIKPFFLFDYQKKIVRKIQEAELSGADMDLLVDKPRGMGITWIIVAYMYWRWLYTPSWTGFVLSRTETEVDDGTDISSNSIFGKLRWMIKKTPKWMLPEGYVPKGKRGTSTDSTLRIINPALNSAIIGSSTNSNAGRSRRYSFVVIDECFAIDRFMEVYRALQSVSRVKVFVSTTKAGSKYKKFMELCRDAGSYVTLSWRDHPWKDQAWYEDQLRKAEYDPEIMKEVDVGYNINPRLQYYPQVAEAVIAPAAYDPSKPVYTGLDFGRNDLTVIVWAQFSGTRISILECYANRERPAIWYAPFLNPDLELEYDYSPAQVAMMKRVREWKKPLGNFGEVAHTQKSMSDNRSIADVLGARGVRLLVNPYAIEHEPRRRAMAALLPRTVFNEDSEGVLDLHDAIVNSRYKPTGMSRDSAMKPVHDDEIADYRAALENLMANFGRVFRHQRKDATDEAKAGGFMQDIIKYLRV